MNKYIEIYNNNKLLARKLSAEYSTYDTEGNFIKIDKNKALNDYNGNEAKLVSEEDLRLSLKNS